MSISLPDVNVLVALRDPSHAHHEAAHRWFAQRRGHGWATCPLTEKGCVRILSNPNYPNGESSVAEAIDHLRILCSLPNHHFWNEDLSLLDAGTFRPSHLAGSRQITDIYLLALAVGHRGKLVTFDRSIPWKAVVGATPESIDILEPA
jgi:toxin-antitoxin system PIN domain toxin